MCASSKRSQYWILDSQWFSTWMETFVTLYSVYKKKIRTRDTTPCILQWWTVPSNVKMWVFLKYRNDAICEHSDTIRIKVKVKTFASSVCSARTWELNSDDVYRVSPGLFWEAISSSIRKHIHPSICILFLLAFLVSEIFIYCMFKKILVFFSFCFPFFPASNLYSFLQSPYLLWYLSKRVLLFSYWEWNTNCVWGKCL